MKGTFPIDKFREMETPFYFYDTKVLRDTLNCVNNEAKKYGNYIVHYAVKANANPKVLSIIRENYLGADCVSGGEIRAAIKAGFPASKIVFAGVGKADWEINLGLDYGIFCFNVESIPELEVINELAGAKGKIASIALRVNPNVGAHTHANITTGLKENKFGINLEDLDNVLDAVNSLPNVKLLGLHFHIGSQILDMGDFVGLCNRVNEIQERMYQRRIIVEHINVGGGLGIDYQHPNRQSIPDFAAYFATFHKHLKLRPSQTLHFELGRSVVGQCGSLISKVLYVKQGANKQFAILDGGMTDLIRPALYQAYHKIENITSEEPMEKYDVVGPICESSDVFGKALDINKVKRGDLFALRSAGAYGEIMASGYNCRALPQGYTSDELI
jgi:diaminopimelate decarboxylase